MQLVFFNKKAGFEYQFLEKFETGVELNGQEVKSIKAGHISLAGSYVIIRGGEAWLIGTNIPPYQAKNAPKEYNENRARRLLLKRKEIDYLMGKTKESGLTLLPTKVYTTKGLIKVEIALARHKKMSDKREVIKKREAQREITSGRFF
ncbi:MAG: SsrA-binding protein [Parcubacteria group bacterium GW2011_GWA2_39_18]|nr:MAG: SsrA-binding protein [Parcubacteria group bacterium GW2011_GWA2_39_18]